MLNKLFVTTIIFIMISGCAGLNTVVLEPVRDRSSNIDLNKILVAKVGEPIVYKIDGKYFPVYIANDDIRPDGSAGGMKFPIIKFGSEWEPRAALEDGTYVIKSLTTYRTTNMAGTENETCLLINPSTNKVYASCYCGRLNNINRDDPNFVSFPIRLIQGVTFPDHIFKSKRYYTRGSTQIQLIYNGISNNSIKLSYKEYVDTFKNPSQSQDLIFDLKESKDIAIKGINIEVLEATNTQIKYKIISYQEQ